MSPLQRFQGWDSQPSRSLVIDEATLHRNITQMQARAGGAELRPHIKTHKSALIARMQAKAGATGFTVALAEEALMLLEAGLGPVTLARPELDPVRLAALMPHAATGKLRFVVDCEAHLQALAEQAPSRVEVLIKVDVGLHRLGIVPDAAVLIALAAQIKPPLVLVGILSHAGHGYGAQSHQALAEIAEAERALMVALAKTLPQISVVSVGATPTLLAGQSLEGITEIRPGNYALLDLTAVGLGVAKRSDIALAVVARVLSVTADRVVIDVGSKVLSSDRGAHGTASVAGFGELWLQGAERGLTLQRLSEEHGVTEAPLGLAVKVGQLGLVLPNHSCPVMNLGGAFTLLPSGERHRLGPTSSDILR